MTGVSFTAVADNDPLDQHCEAVSLFVLACCLGLALWIATYPTELGAAPYSFSWSLRTAGWKLVEHWRFAGAISKHGERPIIRGRCATQYTETETFVKDATVPDY